MEQQILDFVKGALDKGYTDEQIIKAMIEHGIDENKAQQAVSLAKFMLPEKTKFVKNAKIYVLFITLIGLGLMVAVYILRIFLLPEPNKETNWFVALAKAFWPIVFPIIANIINYKFFRQKFLFGLILSLSVVLALVAFILTLVMLT